MHPQTILKRWAKLNIDNFIHQAEELRTKADQEEQQRKSTPTKEILEELEQLKRKQDKKEEAKTLTEELYKRAIENIKTSECERIKINKHDFTNKDEVIDILLFVVGKMAQDPIFYSMNIKKLQNHIPIYK